jgi:hypothetical protein
MVTADERIQFMRTLIFFVMLMALTACANEPLKAGIGNRAAIRQGKAESSVKVANWSEADKALKLAQIYEAAFAFDDKKAEWWPVQALPAGGQQSVRLEFMNLINFPVLKTKNRTRMLIAFEPVSKEVRDLGPRMTRVTYFSKILTVQRIR